MLLAIAERGYRYSGHLFVCLYCTYVFCTMPFSKKWRL